MANTVNEALVRDVIEDVLGRLGGSTTIVAPMPTAKPAGDNGSCGCQAKDSGGRDFGVFQTADEACDAAAKAFKQLCGQGVEARRRIIEIVKSLCEDNDEEWGRIELEETKIAGLIIRSRSFKLYAMCRVSSGCGRTVAAVITASRLRSSRRSASSVQ